VVDLAAAHQKHSVMSVLNVYMLLLLSMFMGIELTLQK
jgi:hypothetical protein